MRRNITHISVCNPELFLSGVCFFSSGTIQAPWSMSICLFFKPLFLLRVVGDPREVILLMCGLFTLLGHSGCLVNLPFGFSVVFYRFCLVCVRRLITRCRSLVHQQKSSCKQPVTTLSFVRQHGGSFACFLWEYPYRTPLRSTKQDTGCRQQAA